MTTQVPSSKRWYRTYWSSSALLSPSTVAADGQKRTKNARPASNKAKHRVTPERDTDSAHAKKQRHVPKLATVTADERWWTKSVTPAYDQAQHRVTPKRDAEIAAGRWWTRNARK